VDGVADGGYQGSSPGRLVLVGGMGVREGVTVREGVAEAVTEGVRVEVSVDVCEGVAEAVRVMEGVNV
jgi:hypothetical protein